MDAEAYRPLPRMSATRKNACSTRPVYGLIKHMPAMHTAVASYKDAENGWATITFHKEFAMMLHSAIGIDPSSDGFQCAYLGPDTSTPRFRSFTITAADLQSFVEWVHACHDPIIAIEGIHGMCRPIEQALAHTDIPLYSFGPFHLTRFRQSILGNNKNNCRPSRFCCS